MFITRATRHDRADLLELLATNKWDDVATEEGVAFIARDGPLIGCLRLVEVAPGTVVVDDVLVRDGHRGRGIGSRLMRAAMNSRGGTLYLCCHQERLGFYGRLGFEEVDIESCPDPVVEYWRKAEDYPTPSGHVHHFMRAR